MNEPITWARLFDGRLWHALYSSDQAWCGKITDAPPSRPSELIEGAPPSNGWVCDRCVRTLQELATSARLAWLQDPRRRPGDQLPGPDGESPPDRENRANTIPADAAEEA